MELLATYGTAIDEKQFNYEGGESKQNLKALSDAKTDQEKYDAQLVLGLNAFVGNALNNNLILDELASGILKGAVLIPEINDARKILEGNQKPPKQAGVYAPTYPPQLAAAHAGAKWFSSEDQSFKYLIRLMQIYKIEYLSGFKKVVKYQNGVGKVVTNIHDDVWMPLNISKINTQKSKQDMMDTTLCRIVRTEGPKNAFADYKSVPINESFGVLDRYFLLRSN